MIIPNSTQVPNVILDEIIPNLKDVELRVLLVIVRQTLGWIEDLETGRRKQEDWITIGYLMAKTGRASNHISKAITKLTELGLIEVRSESGELLNTPKKRAFSGGKMFYRLGTNAHNKSLFTGYKVVDKVGKTRWKKRTPNQIVGGTKVPTTKETGLTKINTNNKYLKNAERQKNRIRLQKMKSVMFNKV